MKRTAPIRITACLLLAGCGALCQQSPEALPLAASKSPETQRQEKRAWKSLPDAPSPLESPGRLESFQAFIDEARSPLTLRSSGAGSAGAGSTVQGNVTLRGRLSSLSFYSLPTQKEDNARAFWDKYLHLSSLRQEQLRPVSVSGGGLVRRTFAAASNVVITHDVSGSRRLNTLYILGALSAATIHTAYRSYGGRSASATFSDLGSTMGSDAGVNVFHEFEPSIRYVVKGHVPQFVFRVQDRFVHSRTLRDIFIPSK